MRKFIIAALLLCATVQVNASLLGEINWSSGVGGGRRVIFDSFEFYICKTSSYSSLTATNMFTGSFFLSDIGTARTANPTKPDYNPLISVLTNGNDDMIGIGLIGIGGVDGSEDYFLNKFVTSYGPGFYGYKLTGITLTLNDASFTSPGTNPNKDGIWTDYTYNITYRFYGELVPEPASAMIMILGAIWMAARRKR